MQLWWCLKTGNPIAGQWSVNSAIFCLLLLLQVARVYLGGDSGLQDLAKNFSRQKEKQMLELPAIDWILYSLHNQDAHYISVLSVQRMQVLSENQKLNLPRKCCISSCIVSITACRQNLAYESDFLEQKSDTELSIRKEQRN